MTTKEYITSKFGSPKRKRHGFYYQCETCQKEFYVFPGRVRYTESKGDRIRFCSNRCHHIGMRGEKNPRWGKKMSTEEVAKMKANPKRRRFDNTQDNPNYKRFGASPSEHSTMKRWRKHIKEIRGDACQKCGYKKYTTILELHHIDCNRKNMKESNLMLLCPTCHEETHYLEGTGKYKKYGKFKSHGGDAAPKHVKQ